MQRLAACLFLLFIAGHALAIDAVVSHTLFYRPDSNKTGSLTPCIEISWQVNPNTLHYKSGADKTIQARIRTDIMLSSASGIITRDRYIISTVPVRSIDEIMQHTVIDLRKYNVPAGVVKMRFVLTDASDSANRFSYTDSFTVEPPQKGFFYSEPQLLDTAYKATGQNAFTSNGMQHVPLSTNFIDDNRHMFYYYAELYNTGRIDTADLPLVQKVMISKSPTEGYYADIIKTDTISFHAPSRQALGKFGVNSLPSGNYYLRITVENRRHEVLAGNATFFQRFNKHPYAPALDTAGKKAAAALADTGMEHVTVLDLKKTFVAKYTLAQVKGILKMLLPFSDQAATRTINGFLKKPDDMYMRYYIYNHFSSINKADPGQAWREFAAKITEVNKMFNTGSTPGYETDRGFIYLRYGAPTDVITVENEPGALPYEIWQYNTLTQLNHKSIPDAVFLFYRQNQIASDFKLLHSNVEGEAQTLQWRSYLYTDPGSDHSDSRADQYIGNK